MLGDNEAVGKAAVASLEHLGGLNHCFTVIECKCSLVQKTTNREQLASLVLVERRPQGPHGLRQDHIRHQQRPWRAAVLRQQRVDALGLRRVIVEPQAQQDVGIDADHRPTGLRPTRAGATLSRKCLETASLRPCLRFELTNQ